MCPADEFIVFSLDVYSNVFQHVLKTNVMWTVKLNNMHVIRLINKMPVIVTYLHLSYSCS
jgi:hypothetical protein